MVHDKKDLFGFLRPLEESCHHALWPAQAARWVLVAKKLHHFPSVKLKSDSPERDLKWELTVHSQNGTRPHQLWQNFIAHLSLPPRPLAIAESLLLRLYNPN